MTEAPLLIYHHIPRTGGTSLRAVVRGNYGPDEVVELYEPLREARSRALAAGHAFDEAAWYRAWYEDLTAQDRERIVCIASHNANEIAPTLERRLRIFCLLRDPVERIWSLYHFLRALGRFPDAPAHTGRGVATGQAIVRNGWSLADIYRELGGGGQRASELHEQFRAFFNEQTRSVLAPWTDHTALQYWAGMTERGTGLRDRALEILTEHYVVGVHDHFDRSLQRFAAAFGWDRVNAPHLNKSGPRELPDAETRSLILAHNQIDAELHAHFAGVVERASAPSRRRETAVCVLGMSRSGTSVTARIINLLGVDLGAEGELMEAVPGNNPSGFWEHKGIADLNEDILGTLGDAPRQRWRWPPRLEEGWEHDPRLERHRRAARSILRRSFAGRRLWGWKDPRNCLTLPFWQCLVPNLRYVICIRHPLDVAASLKERDGMPEEETLRLWLHYMSQAVLHTAGRPRAFVSYEGYFPSWEEQAARLADLIGRPTAVERRRQAIAAHLDDRLWHHRRGRADGDERGGELPPEVDALYTELKARCHPGADTAPDADARLEAAARRAAAVLSPA